MMKTRFILGSFLLITAMLASACSAFPSMSILTQPVAVQPASVAPSLPALPAADSATAPGNANPLRVPQPLPSNSSAGTLAAMQGTLESIYANVNPSVVNIQVSSGGQSASGQPAQQALGSGFVFDNKGNIVTNNHVVAGASRITVTFSDGRVLPAKIVGTDPDADLAVINVANAGQVTPLQLTNSDQVKVGELAVAIGNPFGLSGTMTVGFVSALGRTLPATNETQSITGPSYTIPDVIQTDAAINPGNSGGVLLNDQGQVIGVTAAMETSNGSSAGIGFVIPANIVNRVVPELINNGKIEHPYLGISGTDLNPQLAKAMNLSESQRGALVVSVASGGPAEKAGLKGSNTTAQINGLNAPIGGDVITAINGQKINTFDEMVSYLFKNGVIGKSVKMDILRAGTIQSVDIVLIARPAGANTAPQLANSQNAAPRLGVGPRLSLGIAGISLDSPLAQSMNLNQDQQGVLVERVISGSPAEKAGLVASAKPFIYQGQQILIGGDIITAINGSPVTSVQDLRTLLNNFNPGGILHFTILRSGKEMTVDVTLPTN
jgi:serine protease Do